MSDFSFLRQISFFVVINNVAKGEMFLYLKNSSFVKGSNYFFLYCYQCNNRAQNNKGLLCSNGLMSFAVNCLT